MLRALAGREASSGTPTRLGTRKGEGRPRPPTPKGHSQGQKTMIPVRDIAYALLRSTLGVVFLFSGIGKLLKGPGAFAAGLQERFAGTWLPADLVALFGGLLPYAEAGLGVLLVLGLFNVLALALTGVLVLALTFGAVVEPRPPTVADNLLYALVVFVLLWTSDHNVYALDYFRLGRPRRLRR